MPTDDKDLSKNYRHLIAAIMVQALTDLAYVRANFKITKTKRGVTWFGNSIYPRMYFRKTGLNIEESALLELTHFFLSDYFKELSGMMNFRLDGKTVLDNENLPEKILGLEDVRRKRA